jgi:hypothetical protein
MHPSTLIKDSNIVRSNLATKSYDSLSESEDEEFKPSEFAQSSILDSKKKVILNTLSCSLQATSKSEKIFYFFDFLKHISYIFL